MTSSIAAAAESRCLRCGRKIKSGILGAKCAAKIRAALAVVDLSRWTATQVEDARQAIEDGAVVPSTREGVFHVVSSDGSEVHLTHPHGCNCTSGLRTLPPRPCFHRCAVAIVLASAPGVTLAGAPLAARAAIPAPAPAGDLWAELDRLSNAFAAA